MWERGLRGDLVSVSGRLHSGCPRPPCAAAVGQGRGGVAAWARERRRSSAGAAPRKRHRNPIPGAAARSPGDHEVGPTHYMAQSPQRQPQPASRRRRAGMGRRMCCTADRRLYLALPLSADDAGSAPVASATSSTSCSAALGA
jgi:hypothetical protein